MSELGVLGLERPLGNRYYGMRHGESKANVAGIIVSRIETDRGGDFGLSERGRGQALAAARRCGLGARTVICSSDFARAWQTAQIVRNHLSAAEVIAAPALRERDFGVLDGLPTAAYARVWTADQAREASEARDATETRDAIETSDDSGAGGDGGADGVCRAMGDSEATQDREASQGRQATGDSEASQDRQATGDSEASQGGDEDQGGEARDAGQARQDDHALDGVEPVSAVLDRTVALIVALEREHANRDILLVSHGDTLAILQAGFLGLEPARHRSVPPFGTAEIRPLRRPGDSTNGDSTKH